MEVDLMVIFSDGGSTQSVNVFLLSEAKYP